MDWHAVYSSAQAADVWTSLTVNVWAILTGIGFLLQQVRSPKTPLGIQIVRAAGWSVIYVAFLFAVTLSRIGWLNAPSIFDGVSRTVLAFLVFAPLTYLGYVLLRNNPRQQGP